MDARKRRSHILINKKFQLRYFFNSYLFLVVYFVVVLLGATYFYQTLLDLGVKLQLPENHIFFVFIKEKSKFFLKVILLTFGAASVLNFLFSLYQSQKIAGPIKRLVNFLSDHKNDQGEIQAREGDYFTELFDAVNKRNKNND